MVKYLAMEPCVHNLPEQGGVRCLELLVHLQPAREGHVEHDHQHHIAVAVPACRQHMSGMAVGMPWWSLWSSVLAAHGVPYLAAPVLSTVINTK